MQQDQVKWPIDCFLIEMAGLLERRLRRFTFSSNTLPKCVDGSDYHRASVGIGHILADMSSEYFGQLGADDHPHDDPRWPTKCSHCDYVFKPEDPWQHVRTMLYRRADGVDRDSLFLLEDAPWGSIYDSYWYPDSWKGDDKRCWTVVTPGGEWPIDVPTGSGHRWKRAGEAPFLTVTPSIHFTVHGFHAFLTGGKLIPTSDSNNTVKPKGSYS